MSEIIMLSNVRLSFPHIAEPQKQQSENGERITWNAEFIMPQDHPGFAAFFAAVNKMALDKWKEQAPAVINHVNGDRKKRCYGWGQEKVNSKTLKVYDGYEGNVFIGASNNKQMPQIIDEKGIQVDPNNPGLIQQYARKMYGGCRVNAVVKPWLQENKHGRGIRADFVAIQFCADDAPFGEGVVDTSGLFGATPEAAPGGAMPGFAPPAAAPAQPAWAVPGAPQAAPAMPPAPFPTTPAAPAWAVPQTPAANPPWMPQ